MQELCYMYESGLSSFGDFSDRVLIIQICLACSFKRLHFGACVGDV